MRVLLAHLTGAVEDSVGLYHQGLRVDFAFEVTGGAQGEGVFDIYLAVKRAHNLRTLAHHSAFDEALLADDEFAGALHVAFDGAVHTYITVGHDSTDDFATRSKGVVQRACTLLRCCHNHSLLVCSIICAFVSFAQD